jgi:thioredoxin-related protein
MQNKMKKRILIILLALPLFINAQVSKGILFEKGITWAQIKEKARKENKYIFVDCYASWCVPCKKMDKIVYMNDTVGDFMNDKFISVKVQIDSTKNDTEDIKNWYAVGHSFISDYNITAFPTFLFFSPGGEIVHKEIGSRSVAEFITIAASSLDENRQNYVALRKYKEGMLDYPSMKLLAENLKEIGEEQTSLQVAKDYMHNYLDSLPFNEFVAKPNIDFISRNYKMLTSKDRVFNIYYKHSDLLDSMMKSKGWAKSFYTYIIYREEIIPALETNDKEPNWKKITKTIRKKYSRDIATKLVVLAQLKWFQHKKNWALANKAAFKQIDYNGIGSDVFALKQTYDLVTMVYKHSNNEKELTKALNVIEQIDQKLMLRKDTSIRKAIVDTYAGLLYKSGRKEEAIAMLESYLRPYQNKPITSEYVKLCKILDLMKQDKSINKVLNEN